MKWILILLPGFGSGVYFATRRSISRADGLPQKNDCFFDFDRPPFGQEGDRLPEDPFRFSAEITVLSTNGAFR
jgi:hypothetical protein